MEDMAVKNLEKEKKERIESDIKKGREKYLEYREILRELNKQILVEKDRNKLNRLKQLKESVLKKGGINQ